MELAHIRAWMAAARRTHLPDESAVEAWHSLSEQCRFVKTLPTAASLLDVGAGDGALQIYRSWPQPPRPDLTMFAFALDPGPMFDRYDGYELGRWPEVRPDFGGRSFDAVFAANFIEHIDDPLGFIRWATGRLTARGRIFIEWPRPESKLLPTVAELRSVGLDVMTGNYFDDATHRHDLPSQKAVLGELAAAGMRIEATGVTRVPFFEDHLLALGLDKDDRVSRTLAYWSFTAWCQFVVAERIDEMVGATGIEPVAPAMSRQCSPAELRARQGKNTRLTASGQAWTVTARPMPASIYAHGRALRFLARLAYAAHGTTTGAPNHPACLRVAPFGA